MPTTLTFYQSHTYSAQSSAGITIPIELRVGQIAVRLLAKLDTGASFCIFHREYGEKLGLSVDAGREITVHTANSEFRAFGHTVEVACFDWQFESEVFFPASLEIERNVLGRRGWLQQFRLALVDYDSILHLSHYNQE